MRPWPGTAAVFELRAGIRTPVLRPPRCGDSPRCPCRLCLQPGTPGLHAVDRVCVGPIHPVNATARGSVLWSVCLPGLGTGVWRGVALVFLEAPCTKTQVFKLPHKQRLGVCSGTRCQLWEAGGFRQAEGAEPCAALSPQIGVGSPRDARAGQPAPLLRPHSPGIPRPTGTAGCAQGSLLHSRVQAGGHGGHPPVG